jgi:hypothetical protein
MNSRQFYKDSIMWGVGLWLIGYILGFIFFALVPAGMIGWSIMPIGIAVTLWVLFKKIKGDSFKYYFWLGAVWTVIAVILDYIFIVKALNPADGYYKLDVYIYYILTFTLPIVVGWYKKSRLSMDVGPA